MTGSYTLAKVLIRVVAIFLLAISPAVAQVSGKAFEGFRGNNEDPIQIEADKLVVEDTKHRAIFTGNVKVRQGKSLITTSKLIVHYAAKEDKKVEGGQGDIEQLDLSGGLIVTSEENTVTADEGTYKVKTEDIVLTGNVVVSQGDNVATGSKLVANLKTNQATLSAGEGGRVGTVFTPSKNKAKTN